MYEERLRDVGVLIPEGQRLREGLGTIFQYLKGGYRGGGDFFLEGVTWKRLGVVGTR